MKPAERDYDYAIIGGGIVGLATARELLLRAPGARLALLEKEPSLAVHQTGHNSGVIHTGVYYRPGSLKARLCVNGRAALLTFCDSKGIPYELGGKLIVAVEERERPLLDELEARGRANGVAGITRLADGAIREREPHATGIAALWIPGAGIVDYVAVARAIAEELSHLEADILLDHEALEIRQEPHGVAIRTSRDPVRAKRVVACSGLQCDRVAALSGDVRGLRIIPFRGDYYRLRPEARSLVRSMIYPVPDPRYPFLGVHFTRRIDGDVWAGPNAVLALAREQYGRAGFAVRDAIDIATWPGFWHIVRRHWRMGASELWRDWVKDVYARDLARYVPEIQASDLTDGPCGIRAQAVARDGSFIEDFAIARNGATLHVMNAPSPAATSSFAIGSEIADRVRENGGP